MVPKLSFLFVLLLVSAIIEYMLNVNLKNLKELVLKSLFCFSRAPDFLRSVILKLNRISDYMDLTPVDIVGKRCYQFIHAEDVEGIRQSHLDREC